MSYRIQLASGVTLKEVENRTVLFSAHSGDLFGLNDMAKHSLLGLQSQKLDDFVLETSKRYEVDASTVRQDVEELVGVLVEKKLVVKVEAETQCSP